MLINITSYKSQNNRKISRKVIEIYTVEMIILKLIEVYICLKSYFCEILKPRHHVTNIFKIMHLVWVGLANSLLIPFCVFLASLFQEPLSLYFQSSFFFPLIDYQGNFSTNIRLPSNIPDSNAYSIRVTYLIKLIKMISNSNYHVLWG